jgi:predicted Rossmann fold nucleotide-binding protein DprA/Smf involved in DNA uptake
MDSDMTHHDHLIEQTATLRRKAEDLLTGLQAEQRQRTSSPDAMARATGRSSMDRAIQSAQRMIETLDRTMVELGQPAGVGDAGGR